VLVRCLLLFADIDSAILLGSAVLIGHVKLLLPICLSLLYGLSTRKQKATELGVNVPRGRSNLLWCQFSAHNVKVQG